MGLTRNSIERQLEQSKELLGSRVSALDEKGVEAAARRRDPKWRHLDANCRQLNARLRAVVVVEKREVECGERKTEKEDAK